MTVQSIFAALRSADTWGAKTIFDELVASTGNTTFHLPEDVMAREDVILGAHLAEVTVETRH